MKTKIPDAVLAAEVSRRGLVKTTAIGGLAMASSAFTLPFTRIANAAEAISPAKTGEKVVWSACTVNCGSRCPLRMHVVDGEIKYVETDNTGTMITMACIRFAPACAVVLCVVASITRIGSSIR